MPHVAKQISDTVIGYNVAPYTNITHVASVTPGQSITKSITVVTTSAITWNASFSIDANLFKFLKIKFGLSHNYSTKETITQLYSSTYAFEPGCGGHAYKNYYVASTADLHRIKFLVAPTDKAVIVRLFDCSRVQEVEMDIMVPHQVSFYVCGDSPQ